MDRILDSRHYKSSASYACFSAATTPLVLARHPLSYIYYNDFKYKKLESHIYTHFASLIQDVFKLKTKHIVHATCNWSHIEDLGVGMCCLRKLPYGHLHRQPTCKVIFHTTQFWSASTGHTQETPSTAMLRKTPQLGVITQVITPNQTSSYNQRFYFSHFSFELAVTT